MVITVIPIAVRNTKKNTVKQNTNRRPDSKPAIAIIASEISISARRKKLD